MSKALLEKARRGDVATEPTPSEAAPAQELLRQVLGAGKWTQAELVRSLTIPRGAEYLDNTLVRFLRARKSVAASAQMMDEAMTMRRKFDIDNILSKPQTQKILRHLRGGMYEGLLPTTDKFGRPVLAIQGGGSSDAIHSLLKAPEGHDDWHLHELEDHYLHWHIILMVRACVDSCDMYLSGERIREYSGCT